jgi:hypothetical protein
MSRTGKINKILSIEEWPYPKKNLTRLSNWTRRLHTLFPLPFFFMVPSIYSHRQWRLLLSPFPSPPVVLATSHHRGCRPTISETAPSHGFAPPAPGHGSSLVPLPSRQPPHLLPYCSSARSYCHVSNGSASATNACMRAPEPQPCPTPVSRWIWTSTV